MKNMATALHWIPDTLYNYALAILAANYDVYQKEIRTFHENMLFDVYYQLYKENRLKRISIEFSDLDIFKKVLKVKDKRILLHNCFQAIMDYGYPIAEELIQAFQVVCSSVSDLSTSTKLETVNFGYSLGTFLLDAGWFSESKRVFLECLSLCSSCNTTYSWRIILQLHTRLLCIRNFYCRIDETKTSFIDAYECVLKIKELGVKMNFASIYGEFSSFYFEQYDYKQAYRWSLEALNELNSCLYPKDIIRVLCHAAKACISKREYKRSEMLIKQALHMAKEKFGTRSLIFASTLLNYGYYLISIDSAGHGLKAFQTALDLYTHVFGRNNLLVATCHEYLSYASYIYGYSAGRFKDALDHADKALNIIQTISNEDNFLLIAVKKDKALILEEMALDSLDYLLKKKYFAEALDLHSSAIQFTLQELGELNLYTAKHYSNLGRLFQSMTKYKEAQKMFLKSIAIKEALLGPDDFEVALSLSSLASMYTYDMELHQEAEVLFLRSIEIVKKFLGDGYSGLIYDYRGLLRIYTNLDLSEKVFKYRTIIHKWKELRDKVSKTETDFSVSNVELEIIPPENIISHFTAFQ